MDKLFWEGTETTPQVLLDPESQKYEIKGRSFPEDPVEFYQPIFDWIDNNLPEIDHKIIMDMYIEYFNSSSNRMILLIMKKLEEHLMHGKDIHIKWNYDDEEVLGDGQMYSTLIKIPFELNEVSV
ncbi:MAG TPA: DUF1987 domain-containing protein [Salinivirga sp.]|uniref:DUF1987 domain-containing protein n=1 Tax=Salinivirga sp. TaxID=1970192 RepID=UPI002B45CE7E|nr:DUF1987 domain-containing protein [Salinivirga sp.]HKK59667.1 DUF1987 domain-containing protein [Salinivirga sp.]